MCDQAGWGGGTRLIVKEMCRMLGSGMCCNLISASTAVPSRIQRREEWNECPQGMAGQAAQLPWATTSRCCQVLCLACLAPWQTIFCAMETYNNCHCAQSPSWVNEEQSYWTAEGTYKPWEVGTETRPQSCRMKTCSLTGLSECTINPLHMQLHVSYTTPLFTSLPDPPTRTPPSGFTAWPASGCPKDPDLTSWVIGLIIEEQAAKLLDVEEHVELKQQLM